VGERLEGVDPDAGRGRRGQRLEELGSLVLGEERRPGERRGERGDANGVVRRLVAVTGIDDLVCSKIRSRGIGRDAIGVGAITSGRSTA
jgi:hypothetical protein